MHLAYNVMLLSKKKEWTIDTCSNKDESQNSYAQRKKPETLQSTVTGSRAVATAEKCGGETYCWRTWENFGGADAYAHCLHCSGGFRGVCKTAYQIADFKYTQFIKCQLYHSKVEINK